MKMLAIETSSEACSVALQIEEKIFSYHEIAPQQQAKIILPRIEKLFQDAKITLQEIDAIAFGCGPGSFTGIRIAVSVAQGLGYAANLPLIPISSLAALAQTAYEALGWKKIAVAMDARMQEIYCGLYVVEKNSTMELIGKEKVGAPETWKIEQGEKYSGVGNGWNYAKYIPFIPFQCDMARLPTASAVLSLARILYENKKTILPRDARAIYLRDTVAKKERK